MYVDVCVYAWLQDNGGHKKKKFELTRRDDEVIDEGSEEVVTVLISCRVPR